VNTHLKGRWQVLSRKPLLICDTGHNLDGIREVVKQIRVQPYKHLYMVIGMVKDKDIHAILDELPKEASYFFCQASIPRALPAEDLWTAAEQAGLHGRVIADVNDAIHAARQVATENDFIFVGGSTFVVAEIENL
jgi:dihydrofolate synthase/folylpolyglutamate synthase